MTSHDMPMEEMLKILEEDRRSWMAKSWQSYAFKKNAHTHTFDQIIIGQTRNWHRCNCGEWKEQ